MTGEFQLNDSIHNAIRQISAPILKQPTYQEICSKF